jgi:hypothetical protein
MATLAQPVKVSTPDEVATAEQALLGIFDEIDETLTPEQRTEFYAELRASAIARGE